MPYQFHITSTVVSFACRIFNTVSKGFARLTSGPGELAAVPRLLASPASAVALLCFAKRRRHPRAALLAILFLAVCSLQAIRADINVLIVAPSGDYNPSSSNYDPSGSEKFDPSAVRSHLHNILVGTTTENVNVVWEDTTNRGLAAWFHNPYNEGSATRWAKLRGENGTVWDYVVLLDLPYSMENFPGWYTQGAAMVAAEVAKGPAETVLLMPWPGPNSSSTVNHYEEVVYRTGRTLGCKVAPAGLAWQAAGEPVGTTHPSASGAYIAAASIYSRVWGASASTSSYTYNDTLADITHTAVSAAVGANHYSGLFNSPTKIHAFMDRVDRKVNFVTSALSTETYIMKKFEVLAPASGVQEFINAPVTVMRHDRYDSWGNRPDGVHFGFSHPGESGYTNDGYLNYVNSEQTYRSGYMHNEWLGRNEKRQLPGALLHAQLWKMIPNYPIITSQHLNGTTMKAMAAFEFTLFLARCPFPPQPNPVTDEWLAYRTGYETAWRLGRLQARAPGFRILPSAYNRHTVEPLADETMRVQFSLPLQENVTVAVSTNNPAVTVSPATLNFTPANGAVAQSVTISVDPALPRGTVFNINYATSSIDEVCDSLSDSWQYNVNQAPVANNLLRDAFTMQDTPVILSGYDPDGESLNYTVTSQPAHGSVVQSGRTAVYTPDAGYTGSDSFTFKVNDGYTDSTEGTVNLIVREPSFYNFNLLNNGSAELAPITDYDWVVTSGGITRGTNGVTDGIYSFANSTGGNTATAYQDVDISHYQGHIAAGLQTFRFMGSVKKTTSDTLPLVRMEYRDATGQLLDSYEFSSTVNQTSVSFDHSLLAPINTTTVRIFISLTNSAFVDNLVLSALKPVNSAPVAINQTNAVASSDISNLILVDATDLDNDELTYMIVTPPAHGTITGTGPDFGYLPDPSYIGPDRFTFKANDGTLDSNVASVSIAVVENQPPVIVLNSPTTNAIDIPLNISVLFETTATDDGKPAPLSYSWSGPAGAVFTSTDEPYTGVLNISDGAPPGDYTLTVSDGDLSVTETITLNINYDSPVNMGSHVVAGSAYNGFVGRPIPLADASASDDARPNPPAVLSTTWQKISGPGEVVFTDVSEITTDATFDTAGSYVIRLIADDGAIKTFNQVSVTITEDPGNRQPVANAQHLSVNENSTDNAVLLTGNDADNDPLIYSIVTPPAHGTLTGTPPNLSYTPATGFFGDDSVIFKVNDGKAGSKVANLSITVIEHPLTVSAGVDQYANYKPQLPAGLYYGTVSGNINLTDPNPQSQILVDVSSETENSIGNNVTEIYTGSIYDADGKISFTERIDDQARIWIDGVLVLNDANWSNRATTGNLNLSPGWHNIEIRISSGGNGRAVSYPGIGYDPNGGSNWRTLVDPGDGSLLRVNQLSGVDLTLTGSATNLFGDSTVITWSMESGPKAVTFTTPTAIQTNARFYANGTYVLRLTIDDGTETVFDEMLVTVSDSPNNPPVVFPQSVLTLKDQPKSFTLSGSDADGNALTYTIVDAPANGVLDVSALPDVIYTPNPDYFGTDSFTFTANDGIVDSTPGTISITIVASNAPPVVNAGTDRTVAISTNLPWTPANLSPAAWYDAADTATITASSGAVSQWSDKSGNDNHATQGTSGNRPTTGGDIGGRNAISFNGDVNSQYLATGLAQLTTVSMYLVADATQRGPGQLSHGPIGANTDHTTAGFGWSLEAYNSGEAINSPGYNASSVYGNGVLGGTHNFDATLLSHQGTGLTTDNKNYHIGDSRQGNSWTGSRYKGLIGEIIICPVEHDADTRMKVEGYLAHKWGLVGSLPTGHPYQIFAPGETGATVVLDGSSVTDPDDDTLSQTWTVVSVPAGGTAVLDDPNLLRPTVTFDTVGLYKLRLTADDGIETVFDEMTINVLAGSNNTAPTVDAGTNQTIQLPTDQVSLDGTVSDDGLPEGATVSTTWSKVSGPGTVTCGNAAAVDTTATFGAAGVYVLRLTASDGQALASDDVTITVAGSSEPKFFGTIWQSWTSSSAEPAYIGSLFNQVTPENAGKWGVAEPTQGNFNWTTLDAMFNRAESELLVTKQHCFVWGQQQPDWVNDSNAKTAVTNWMHAFMNRYGDKVDFIDVVNEPLHAKPSYRNGLGGDGATGWDWMIWVFEQARIHAPNAKLLLNDYNILNNDGATTTYKGLIELLQSRGLIDGIGLQAHFLEGTSAAQIKRNLDTLAQTGLPIYISEYDVNIANDQSQLSVYQSQFPVFWEHPAVNGITLWGFRQGTMWRTDAYLVRTDSTERPALTWLRDYFLANNPPYVHAGADQTIQLPVATVSLDGTVTDDGLPEGASVSTTWSKVSGPGAVTFGGVNAVGTTAAFSAAGNYVLRLTASDTEFTKSDDVQVTVNAESPSGTVVAINCGGGSYAAVDGTEYWADANFSGGSTYSTGDAIAGTEDDTLYQSERYGAFTYSVPVPNGTYDVVLQFAEIYDAANGKRVFDVSIEGAVAVNDLDIHAIVGHDAAYDVPVNGIAVSDGALTITTSVVAGNPKLSAFRIISAEPAVNEVPAVNAGTDQTVAISTGMPWTPADLSPAAWYNAADSGTITASSGAVSQWSDKSGKGNHVAQATSTARPTTGTRTLNGLNVLDFDGSNDELLDPTFASLSSLNLSVFAVQQHDRLELQSMTAWGLGRNTSEDGLIMHSSFDNSFALGYRYPENKPVYYTENTNAELLSYVKSGTSSQQAWVDGLSKGGQSGTVTTFTTQRLALGSRFSANYLDGAIAEFIVIPSSVSGEDRQKLEGYLAHKWGLEGNLPAGHPYESAAPEVSAAVVSLSDASVTDADGDTLSHIWTLVSAPAGATAVFDDESLVNATVTFDTVGAYVLRLTADDGIETVFDELRITVTDGSNTLANWISGYELGGLIGMDDDYDGDGLANGIENYLGTDPGQANPGLTDTEVHTVDGATTFTFGHPLHDNPASDISVRYRWSKDLATFHEDGATDREGTTVHFSQSAPLDGRVTVAASIEGTATDRVFVQLVVTQN